jgi:CRP/FNR family transcriptional regulator, cyclic AMP receptor protein
MPSPDDRVFEVKTFLKKVLLFSGISASSLQTLAEGIKVLRVKKGQFIFLQDENCEKSYIVRSGKISILLESQDGRKLVINEMHAGDFFGEVGILTNQTRSSSAVARVDSEVMVLPQNAFLKVLSNEPALVRQLLEMSMNRLRESTERESALAFLNANGRLARLLLQLAHQELQKGYITISQEELAERTGQTRQTVAKALGKWRRSGWLITGRGRIMLLNYDALADQEYDESL